MLKRCKQLILGVFIGSLVFGVLPTLADTLRTFIAEEANFPVVVDGVNIELDMPVVTIDGRTYLPLRAMGDILGVNVDWNEEKQQAEVVKRGIKLSNLVENNASSEISEYSYATIDGNEYILFSDVDNICMRKKVSATYSTLNMLVYLAAGRGEETLTDITLHKFNDTFYVSKEEFEGKVIPFIGK